MFSHNKHVSALYVPAPQRQVRQYALEGVAQSLN